MGDNLAKIVAQMRRSPANVRYDDLQKVCDSYFEPRPRSGSSHRSYKTPWAGNPRVNIQNANGMAKAYQVRQVLKAIDRLEREEQ